MSHTEYLFWLMPAELLKSRLQAVVRDLAAEFDAPVFDPHITFYIGRSNVEEAGSIAEEIANEFAPVELEAEGLEHSEHYNKTFYVQFGASDIVSRMCEMVRGSAAVPAPYVLNPHLSLLYKKLTEGQRKELCRRPIVPMGHWRFDAIRVVEHQPPWSEKAAKESRIVGDYGLREGYRRRRDDLK